MESTAPDAPVLVNDKRGREMLGGISEKHAFNLRKSGKLPYVLVGQRIMYRVESLHEFARKNERQGVKAC